MYSFVWGRLADVWSRKNVFMWSAIGIAFSCFLFGFSTSFSMAVAFRFFVGLLNGESVSERYVSAWVEHFPHKILG